MIPLLVALLIVPAPGGDLAKERCKVEAPPKAAAAKAPERKPPPPGKLEPLRPDCPTAAQRVVPGLF